MSSSGDMSAVENRAEDLLARVEKAKRKDRGHWCDARAALDAVCDVLPSIIKELNQASSPEEVLEAQDHAFYDGMSKAKPRIPDDCVLVRRETLADLVSDAELYVHGTEYRPDRIDQKLASVREAKKVLYGESEAAND